MRKIPIKKRMEVLKLYFSGYSYDDIVRRTGVSKGSVVNIIKELRDGRYPEFEDVLDIVEELRDIAFKVRKYGLKPSDAFIGFEVFKQVITNLCIEPSEIRCWIRLCKGLKTEEYDSRKIVNYAVKLMKLEGEVGKPYEDALVELEGKLKETMSRLGEAELRLKELEERRSNMERELKELEAKASSTRRDIDELVRGKKSLMSLGVDRVAKLAALIDDYEALGYDPRQVKELARLKGELINIGIRPSKLREQIKNMRALKREIAKLAGDRERLEYEVDALERRLISLKRRCKSLHIVDDILKTRIVEMACRYCGRTMFVSVPTLWELEGAMKRGLVYPTRCHYCGYTNHISPRDILASIAWSILAI